MAVDGRGGGRVPIPPEERRARRWRLLVIVVVAAALLGGIVVVGHRVRSDRAAAEAAADAAARAVATELGPQLSSVNLAQAFVAYAAWVVNGRPPRPFPSSPHVDAALLDFSATPTSVTMTYRVTSHGVARCVTGTYSAAAGAATTINDCVHR